MISAQLLEQLKPKGVIMEPKSACSGHAGDLWALLLHAVAVTTQMHFLPLAEDQQGHWGPVVLRERESQLLPGHLLWQ